MAEDAEPIGHHLERLRCCNGSSRDAPASCPCSPPSGPAARADLATISKGTVTKIKPVADIEENAVLRAAFAGRAMEGTIGVRTRQGDYASGATLPVRIEFAKSPVRGELTGKIHQRDQGRP